MASFWGAQAAVLHPRLACAAAHTSWLRCSSTWLLLCCCPIPHPHPAPLRGPQVGEAVARQAAEVAPGVQSSARGAAASAAEGASQVVDRMQHWWSACAAPRLCPESAHMGASPLYTHAYQWHQGGGAAAGQRRPGLLRPLLCHLILIPWTAACPSINPHPPCSPVPLPPPLSTLTRRGRRLRRQPCSWPAPPRIPLSLLPSWWGTRSHRAPARYN